MSKSTLEEELLLQFTAAGIETPAREYKFHKTRRWKFDFYWPSIKVACECEGGVWIRGRHNRPQGFISDCEKYSEAALMGICVIRVTEKHIKDGVALDMVKRAWMLNLDQVMRPSLGLCGG
jgi:hypothetical protein